MARKTRKTTARKGTVSRKVRSARNAPAMRIDPAAVLEMAKSSARKALDAGIEATATVRNAALKRVRMTQRAAASQVENAKARTADAVSHLERVFEERVARAIAKLGIPSTDDVRALSRQVAKLQASVESLRRTRSRG